MKIHLLEVKEKNQRKQNGKDSFSHHFIMTRAIIVDYMSVC